MEPIIKVDNVSMCFNLSKEKHESLKEYFLAMVQGRLQYDEFYALKDVSLDIMPGDFYGLVGLNGSGKSTLLKTIAGVYKPSKGKVTVNGTIAPLIELGAGCDMDLTARENIYLNGTVLGFSPKYLDEKFDEIVEFSELENFLDVPLKNYSSGMVARIGFAIATITKPDILIADEVLAVGDFLFQQKCEKRMKELMAGGTTVILVSHSRDEIYRFSEELLVIDDGKQICYGDTKAIFDCPEQVEAARLTGCKNIVQVKRLDEHSIEIPDWGTRLHLEQEIDAEITHIGLRAHEFIPVWGEREDNCIPVKEKGKAEFPFEWKYFLKGETEESDDICWYVQKNLWDELTEKGIPDYLKLPEKEILLLK